MNRRGFLGSVLGWAAGIAAMPGATFLAREADGEWQRALLPYRMLVRTEGGLLIQAPGVASVSWDPEWGAWTWRAEDLEMRQSLTTIGGTLLTEGGRVICESAFDRPACVQNGDVLRVTQRLRLYANGKAIHAPLEEVVDAYLRRGR